MLEKQVYTLQTDEYFKQLIPPLSSREQKQLEENILKEGCQEPLCVWGDIIIDGHNRYEICTRLNIPFYIQSMSFNNRDEIIAWICTNQLCRKNISVESRRYLIGKRYETEKILGFRNSLSKKYYSKKELKATICHETQEQKYQRMTALKLGNEYQVGERTIRQYGRYTRAIDIIAKKEPKIASGILTGKIKVSYRNILKLTKQPIKVVKNVKQKLNNYYGNFVSYSNTKKIIPAKKQKITVKDMPIYDPDAEISSLTLTIPSWISSIERTLSNADFTKISNKAKIKLEDELKKLEYVVDVMQLAVEEK